MTQNFIIYRLFIDTLENRAKDAYGFKLIGFVETKEEAERIASLEFIDKSKYPWPLEYATEFENNVPRFIYRKLNNISDSTLEELKKYDTKLF